MKEPSLSSGPPTRAPTATSAAALPGQSSESPSVAAGTSAIADVGLAEHERQFHRYVSNDIPWWVRAMWIGYWIGAISYVTRYLIPMVRATF